MENNKIYMIAKDYTVSNETFGIQYDTKLHVLTTFPKPSAEALPKYYQSKEYISHTDANNTLFEKIYQIVKVFAIKKKVSLIARCNPAGKTLLDIGAGTGDFCVGAKQSGWECTAVEPNISVAKIVLAKGIECLPDSSSLSGQAFDVITMWHVLEHVPDLDKQLFELRRLLKPDGTIIIAVPNYKSFDANYYGMYWAAFDVPRHIWHFSISSIEKVFSKHNFKLLNVLPLWFDSFYVSMLSEKYQNGKINFLKAFYIGFKSNYMARQSKQFSSLIYIFSNK